MIYLKYTVNLSWKNSVEEFRLFVRSLLFFSGRHKRKITIIQINISLFKISAVSYHKSFNFFFLLKNLGPVEGKHYTFSVVISILEYFPMKNLDFTDAACLNILTAVS